MNDQMEVETEIENASVNVNVTEALRNEENARKNQAKKPFIDHLPNAVQEVDGKLQFILKPGEKVVIERCSVFLANAPWLDTKIYLVAGIDHSNGDLHLVDEDLQHLAMSNFITGTKSGYKFKIPPKKGSWVSSAPALSPDGTPISGSLAGKSQKSDAKLRRVYSTGGLIHMRLKNFMYAPTAETKASSGDHLEVTQDGLTLKIRHPKDGWEEVWHRRNE